MYRAAEGPNSAGRHSGSEADLFAEYRRGVAGARDEILRRNMGLARGLAARYRSSSESRDDLEQVAYLGLVKAFESYDPQRGPFRRLAVPYMLGELKRHFRDRGWMMRVPRAEQANFLEVRTAIETLSTELGHSPSTRELASHTGLTVESVLEALQAKDAYATRTLDGPLGEDECGQSLHDVLGSDDGRFDLIDEGQALAPAFDALPGREREILRLRFVEDLTQRQIAERIGISQMHVSRLLARSLAKLQAGATEPISA